MKDTIISGTGNRRSLILPPDFAELYPTWESFRDAAKSGIPMDIGPLNPDGCRQIGDALNKENLLKDSTAALYGLPGKAVVDEVLERARSLISEAGRHGANLASGSFSGTGGASTLTLFKDWEILLLITHSTSSGDINDTKALMIVFKNSGLAFTIADRSTASINASLSLSQNPTLYGESTATV